MDIINPSTGKILHSLTEDNPDTIRKKYSQLVSGQRKWKKLSLEKRIQCISDFSELLEKNKDELAQTLTNEMGKPLWQSHNELKGAQYRIKFFLDNSEKYLEDEWQITEGNTKEKIAYEALGTIANISAWNYPYLVGVNVFIPALIDGNAVIYKPSEYSTLTGLKIEELLHEAGVPADCFLTVVGGKEAGQALLDLPMDGYFFTGSYITGKYIAQRVASKLVPCQLELGGNDPLYVMDDVEDIKKTADSAVEGVFYNNGQSCCAVKRIYVHEKIYDSFVKFFMEELARWKVGDPMAEGTMIGPLSRKEHIKFLDELVSDALKKGAEQHTVKSNFNNEAGFFYNPTVLLRVNHTMRVMKEETFGPVIGIQKVKDDNEAAYLMADTVYGLTASVFSKNKKRAEQILEPLNTGTAYWNCCDRVSPYLPWSGRKQSGLGCTLSHLGIRAFTRPKGWHLRE